jgi:hypothetical protein
MKILDYVNRATVSAVVAILALVANATALPDLAGDQEVLVNAILSVVASVATIIAAFSTAPQNEAKIKATDEQDV